jgi:hypothetical protein
MSSLDKSTIEKQIEELEGKESGEFNEELSVAKSKIDALNSTHYEKI